MAAGALRAQSDSADQRFQRLLQDILIIDTHIDTPWYIVDEGYDLGVEHDYNETDIPRLKRGHVGAVFVGVPAQPEQHPSELWVARSLDLIDAVHEAARRYPNDLEVAYTAADIRRIHGQRKIAALISIEGGHQIQDDLRILRDYYRLGVRYMTLAHFRSNNWADSGTDRAVHNGLSRFGREVVAEMNRLGMMVDISHVSDKTFADAIEVSRSPVIASHSSVRALCDIPRNMSDDMLRALAKNGGVIFINFSAAYLDSKAYQAFAAFRDRRDREIASTLIQHTGDPRRWELKRAIQQRYRRMLPPVDIKVALRHIDYVAKLIGPNHVGIGSDFDGISGMVPQGLEDVSKFPGLARGLIEMGYSDADIRKIMGQNLLRVMQRSEEVARSMT
jgi:membrane dipeptidase